MQLSNPVSYETKPLWVIQAFLLVSLPLALAGSSGTLLQCWLIEGRHGAGLLANLERSGSSLLSSFAVSLIGLVGFAGIPGAVIFFLNYRSWRAAATIGGLIAFCFGAGMTLVGGLASGPHAAAWVGGQPTMIDGSLTAYGRSLYGLSAALKTGALTSPVGAGLAIVLWRIAFRPRPRPLSQISS